jgi:hypothetical protein
VGDVGIDLLKPKYGKPMIVAEDVAYWEVLYDDGTVLCEAAGAKYNQIDRSRLESFRIIHNGTIVFEMFPKLTGKSGWNLIYRRRTALTQEVGGRAVLFIVGLGPDGPLFGIDIANNQYFEDTANLMSSLALMPGEPDDLLPWKAMGFE